MSTVNISAYKFVSLDDLPALRERVLERCTSLALKGTVLLAPEGINIFLAGARDAIDAFMTWLHHDLRFADMVPKESLSDAPPFGRMRVRLKKEIITMRLPTVRPEGGRAPAVDPLTLQRWLAQGHDDAGRELLLLDTRNQYETAVGAFDDDGKTVVSYCTGGIRCEKAALHMQDLGMSHVYQLDGGILKYLEQTDGTHWHGDCFVFDERGAVDPALAPAPRSDP